MLQVCSRMRATTLPLQHINCRLIAVIGPNTAALPALKGNYNAIALSSRNAAGCPWKSVFPDASHFLAGFSLCGGSHLCPSPRNCFLHWRQQGRAARSQGRVLQQHRLQRQGCSFCPCRPSTSTSTGTSAPSRWSYTSNKLSLCAGRACSHLPPPGTIVRLRVFEWRIAAPAMDAETVKVWLDGKLVVRLQPRSPPWTPCPDSAFDLTLCRRPGPPCDPHRVHPRCTWASGAGLTFNWQPPVTVLREAGGRSFAIRTDGIVAFLRAQSPRA